MPRILPLPNEQYTADTRQAFEKHVCGHHSRITNMKATMGWSLPVFEVYMHWYDLYEEVKKITGPRLAYLFAHAISAGSNCPLCTTYFRKIIIDNGERPEQLVLTGNEQALIDFGAAIAIRSGEVSDDVYRQIAALYTPAQIVLLVGFAGQMIATNIFNNVLQVQIDEYLTGYVSVTQ
jgi:alkylhydroperoxidase family enzyme